MSYPVSLASRTSSVLLALCEQANHFTLREVRKDLVTLRDPSLELATGGATLTASQDFNEEDQRLRLRLDGGFITLTAEGWESLRRFGDSVFRQVRHIDGALVLEAEGIQRSWKMGVKNEKVKADEKRDRLSELYEASQEPWRPTFDPQLEMDFDDERDQREIDRLAAEQMADAVESGDLEEIEPPAKPKRSGKKSGKTGASRELVYESRGYIPGEGLAVGLAAQNAAELDEVGAL